MKEIMDKKAKRKENKKNKMLAELELYRLKDEDKQAREMCDSSKRERKLSIDFEEPSEIVSNSSSVEPKPKRQKKENEQSPDQLVDCQKPSPNKNNPTTETKTDLTEEELAKLRQTLREKKNFLKTIPRLRLKPSGEDARLILAERTPIFLSDIQHLLMYSQLGQASPYTPRWVILDKYENISHTVLLLVEGVSVYDYFNAESSCPCLSKINIRTELLSPFSYGGSIVEEMCTVPLSKTQKAKLERKFGNLSDAVENKNNIFKMLKTIFHIKPPMSELTRKNQVLPEMDNFARTDLLLSVWQLVEEGYPVPLIGDLKTRYSNFVYTKDTYTQVTPHSPMWAVDCEMCQTTEGPELTRISIVNENCEVVYESLVKPYNRIVNYLTRFSGITYHMLKNVHKRIEHVHQDLRKLLPSDVILVGQSLNMDLLALKMMHPYIIDTSVIYNLSGERHKKSKLAKLAEIFLKEKIQQGRWGHDSVEDSSTSMKLVQLKLKNTHEFGDAVLCGPHNLSIPIKIESLWKEPEQKESSQLNENNLIPATSLFSHIVRQNKTVSLISSNDVLSEYSTFITAATYGPEEYSKVECQASNSNEEAIEKTLEEMMKHKFCLTHLQLSSNENIVKVNEWANKLWNKVRKDALLIIVLAGSPSFPSNGVAFLDVVRDKPQ